MSRRILVWFWSHGGGGSQFALNLARRLSREFEVRLSMSAGDPTAEFAESEGIEVRRAHVVSHRQRPWSSMIGLGSAAATLRMHAADCDVVIAAMNFATLAPLCITVKKPLVYCAHDPVPHTGDYAILMQRASQAAVLRRADVVVAHSVFAANQLLRDRSVAAKLKTVPLQSVFKPSLRSLHCERAGPRRFLFAGRMIAYKGLALLADAFDLISTRQDWRLSVIGAGPAMTDPVRRRLTHPQVDLRNEFSSWGELDRQYAACDVVLAPYLDATQSGVVAEALAHGKPCIVTPVGALPEQIGGGDAGWVAQAVTPNAVAEKLRQVLDSSISKQAEGAARLAASQWGTESWRWVAELH